MQFRDTTLPAGGGIGGCKNVEKFPDTKFSIKAAQQI